LPTDFDDCSPAAHAHSPLPSEAARRNRATLQAAMKAAGFKTIRLEWWHFDDPDAKHYSALDVPVT
jgi:D-alanyl-D-alanine dipeptidase